MSRAPWTEAVARSSSRHPWRVLAAWGAVLVLAVVLVATFLGSALTGDDGFTGRPESVRAEQALAQAFPPDPEAFQLSAIVLVHSQDRTVDDPVFRQRVSSLLADLRGVRPGIVHASLDPTSSDDPRLVSPDRHTAAIALDVWGDADDLAAVVAAQDGSQGFETVITGDDIVDGDIDRLAKSDLARGEMIGLGLALVVLLVVFGSVVASLLPILTAVASIVVALALTALVGQWHVLSDFTINMLVMMGLAVGIDASLLVVSRFGEARRRGLDVDGAVAEAGRNACRSVVWSGGTVVLALCGMLIVPHTIFRSLAAGAILVVIAAVAAALTLLPALLGLLGDRVFALRVPVVGRRQAGSPRPNRVVAAALRRPWPALLVGVGVLLALALPVTGMKTASSGVSTLPDRLQSKRGFELFQQAFPSDRVEEADVVATGGAANAVARAASALATRVGGDAAYGPASVEASPDGSVVNVSVPVQGDPKGEPAMDAVRQLRGTLIPEAFAGSGAEVLVGGETADDLDFAELADRYRPLVFGLVLTLSLILLAAAFRSVALPLLSVGTNLLSVGAAYGLLVLVFERGIGGGLFGFAHVPTVESWLPLFLFTILFGLSMDYQVFLLSRIRERYLECGDTDDAVRTGIGSTARVITGAALIMVAVFAGFASGELVMFQQLGFGLGAAILIDATLVRCVLVPAAVTLLGRAAWWWPGRRAERGDAFTGSPDRATMP